MSRYKLRRSVGVAADVAGSELERIHSEFGSVTPAIVVEEARPVDAPLHAAFTWDNSKAAEQFRLIEARNLIRSVHVISEAGEDQGCAFVHLTVTDEGEAGAYLPVADVVNSPDLLAIAVRGLSARLEGAQRALADLEAQARAAKQHKTVKHVSRARKATETATRELGAII